MANSLHVGTQVVGWFAVQRQVHVPANQQIVDLAHEIEVIDIG
jgi:hypothetical protein